MKEIDIVGLSLKVIKKPKSLIAFIVIFTILGIIVALNTPKKYTSSVVLAPELSSGGLGVNSTLSDMASNFGIDISSSKGSMDALYPEIYPDIFASNDFIVKLFNIPIRLEKDNRKKSYYTHLVKDSKTPFWDYPKIWISQLLKKPDGTKTKNKDQRSGITQLSMADNNVCEAIKGSISCDIDKSTSVITISATDEDRLVAAIIADTLKNRLQEYITRYRTKKAKSDVVYYSKLYVDAKKAYDKSMKEYASYCDANQGVILQSFISQRDEMENNMQLKYNAFNQYATQLQVAKAKLQEVTPAFTVLQDAYVPVQASGLSRTIIVFIWILLGIVADALWVLLIKGFLLNKK